MPPFLERKFTKKGKGAEAQTIECVAADEKLVESEYKKPRGWDTGLCDRNDLGRLTAELAAHHRAAGRNDIVQAYLEVAQRIRVPADGGSSPIPLTRQAYWRVVKDSLYRVFIAKTADKSEKSAA